MACTEYKQAKTNSTNAFEQHPRPTWDTEPCTGLGLTQNAWKTKLGVAVVECKVHAKNEFSLQLNKRYRGRSDRFSCTPLLLWSKFLVTFAIWSNF